MFYVYMYRDPRPNKNMQPVYVGKGCCGRDVSHWQKGSHSKPLNDFFALLRRLELEPRIERVAEFDNEEDAFNKEKELIALFGRRDLRLGPLFNQTDGGDGAVNVVQTEEKRRKNSEHSKAMWKDPTYVAKVTKSREAAMSTEEFLTAKSKKSTQMWEEWTPEQRSEVADKIRSARNTPESKKKTAEASRGAWEDAESREKMLRANAEIGSRPEVREARRQAANSIWSDPEKRAEMVRRQTAGAAARKRPVVLLPSGEVFDSADSMVAATGISRASTYKMLKGWVPESGKYAGMQVKYVDSLPPK